MHVTCVDWTDVLGADRSRRSAARPASCSSRSTARRSTASGTSSGYPSHGDYRDSHRLTPRAHAVWANDGSPYDPERGAARARARRRGLRRALATAPVVAFDTELFGHHWHEGVDVPGGRARAGGRRRRSTSTRAQRRAPTRRRRAGATAATCGPGARRATARLDAAQRRAGSARRRPVAARAARAARAAELGLGVPDRPPRPPATTRANAPPPTIGVSVRARRTNDPTNCGIWLPSWRIGPSSSPEDSSSAATLTMFWRGRRVESSPVIRAEFLLVCPEGSGGTDGAMVRLPGRIAVNDDGVAQVFARARQLTP